MKTTMLSIIAVAALLCATSHSAAAQFSRSAADFIKGIKLGINIGNTLDVPSGNETEWGNRQITRSLLRLYKSKDINAVRVPVTWRRQFDRNDPKHEIRPAFLGRVQEVVDMCIAEGFVTILNIHHDGGSDGWPEEWLTIDGVNEDRANALLADLWRQIATHFRDYGEKLVFEGFNEIRKAKSHPGEDGQQSGKDDWGGNAFYCKTVNRYAKTFYDTVRATGGNNAKRYLVIPTYAATGHEPSCLAWEHPNPSDNHVMVDLHIYEPGWFCLWGDRTDYNKVEFQKRLLEVFSQHKRIFLDKGVPVVIGEVNAERRYHGGDKSKPNDEDRVKWAKHFGFVARRFGCPCFIWEPGGYEGMGLIDRAKVEWSHPEIVDAFNAGRKAADKKR